MGLDVHAGDSELVANLFRVQNDVFLPFRVGGSKSPRCSDGLRDFSLVVMETAGDFWGSCVRECAVALDRHGARAPRDDGGV